MADTGDDARAVATVGTGAIVVPTTDIIERVRAIHDQIPGMSEAELLETYKGARYLGKQAWLVSAHILWETRRRGKHGDVRSVAAQFGLSKSQASVFIRTWETFAEHFATTDLASRLVGAAWYTATAYSDDPHGWIALAAERKDADPGYRVDDLRAEIVAAEGLKRPPQGGRGRITRADPLAARPAGRPAAVEAPEGLVTEDYHDDQGRIEPVRHGLAHSPASASFAFYQGRRALEIVPQPTGSGDQGRADDAAAAPPPAGISPARYELIAATLADLGRELQAGVTADTVDALAAGLAPGAGQRSYAAHEGIRHVRAAFLRVDAARRKRAPDGVPAGAGEAG